MPVPFDEDPSAVSLCPSPFSFPALWQFRHSLPKPILTFPAESLSDQTDGSDSTPPHTSPHKGSCDFAPFLKDKEFQRSLLCRPVPGRFSWPGDLCQGLSYNSHFCLKAKHSNSGGYYCQHVPAPEIQSSPSRHHLGVCLPDGAALLSPPSHIAVSRTVFQATIHVSFSHQRKQSSSILFLAEIKC